MTSVDGNSMAATIAECYGWSEDPEADESEDLERDEREVPEDHHESEATMLYDSEFTMTPEIHESEAYESEVPEDHDSEAAVAVPAVPAPAPCPHMRVTYVGSNGWVIRTTCLACGQLTFRRRPLNASRNRDA